jgi:hypothetical protein
LDQDVRADVDLVINADPTKLNANEADYLWNGTPFTVGPTNAPPSSVASNSTAPDFAPLTVIYRNIRLAAQFAKERLGLSMPRVPVHAFEIRGAYEGWKLEKLRTKDTWLWKNNYTNASSSTHYDPLSIHFSQMKSSFNQPTTGTLGNQDGYSSLGSVTNVVTGYHYPRPTVFGRERPDNREFHEYGHAIMFHSIIGGVDRRPPLVTNPFTGELDKNHGGYTNSLSTDSWVEGFAEFISAAISSKMLDTAEKKDPNLYVGTGTMVNLDDNFNYTRDVLHQPSMEEFLVASLLWDLYDPVDFSADDDGLTLPIEDLWSVLSANGPKLLTLKGVYDAFQQFGVNFPFRLNPDKWAARAVQAGLYDDLTFQDARAGNGVYDPGEDLGTTSWNPQFPNRWNAEVTTFLTFDVQSADGSSLSNVVFEFEVQYDPPLEDRHYAWGFPTHGPTPVALPFVTPPHPCQITVRPHAKGVAGVAPFITTSTELQQFLGNLPPGGDGELMSHTFVVPAAPRLEIALVTGGTSLELSWPVTDPPFELQYSFSLTPPVFWGRPPGFASRRNDRFVQVLPLPPRSAFLRLIQNP